MYVHTANADKSQTRLVRGGPSGIATLIRGEVLPTTSRYCLPPIGPPHHYSLHITVGLLRRKSWP